MEDRAKQSPTSGAFSKVRSKATSLLTELGHLGHHSLTLGPKSARALGALARRRRNSDDSDVPPDYPLGWQATIESIRRHYALDARQVITWSEAETRRDVRRIAAMSPPNADGASPGYSVLVTDAVQLRHVLATIEALRSWAASRSLHIQIESTDLTGESWNLVAGLPRVTMATGAQLDNPPRADTLLRVPAGRLPLPNWLKSQKASRNKSEEQPRKRLLLLCDQVPDISRGSGSQDIYWFARHAAELGYDVLLVPLSPRNNDGRARWEFRSAGVKVPRGDLTKSRLLGLLPNALHDSDFVAVFDRKLAPMVRSHLDGILNAPRLLFVPLDLKQFPQAALIERNLQPELARFGLRIPEVDDIARLREEEFSAIRASDLTALISTKELQSLNSEDFSDRLVILPMLRSTLGFVASKGSDPRVVFVGGFGHPPNYLAVQWFLDDIWPEVYESFAGVTFEIYGADLDPRWRDEWLSQPGVIVRGAYEEEWEPYLGDVIAVAPLPYGGGTKGKVVSALGHGAVVVGTGFAAEGLPVEVQQSVLVATSAMDFVDHLVSLLTNSTLRSDRRESGRRAYERYFTEECGRQEVQKCLERLSGGSSRSRRSECSPGSGAGGS